MATEDVAARLESLHISGQASGSPSAPGSPDQGRSQEMSGGGPRRKEELVAEERQEEGRRRLSYRTPPPSSPTPAPPEDSLVFLPVEVRPEELRDWADGSAVGAEAGKGAGARARAALVKANGERLAVFR